MSLTIVFILEPVVMYGVETVAHEFNTARSPTLYRHRSPIHDATANTHRARLDAPGRSDY